MEPWLDYIMYPMAKGWEGWVALEDMPESTRLLYTYAPDLAKQMLADAGLAGGFEMDVLSFNTRNCDDIAEMIADQWEEYGITVNIIVKDETAVHKEVRPPAHMEQDAVVWSTVTHTPVMFANTYYGTTGPRNAGYYSSEYFDTRMLAAMKEPDPAKYKTMMEEANLRCQDDVPAIPFAHPTWTEFWWPWVKNCYGEVWYQIHTPDYHNWWIDQDLKAEMGY